MRISEVQTRVSWGGLLLGWASGGLWWVLQGLLQAWSPCQARRNCREGETGDRSPVEGILTNSDLALVAGGPASRSAGPPSETHYQCFVNCTSFGHMKAWDLKIAIPRGHPALAGLS